MSASFNMGEYDQNAFELEEFTLCQFAEIQVHLGLVVASFGKLPHHILETIPFQTSPSLSTDETQSLFYYFQEHHPIDGLKGDDMDIDGRNMAEVK